MRRYPRLRDRSIFVGNPDDLVDDPLGPGLPTVREWTLERYAFSGYVTGSTPHAGPGGAAGRARLPPRRAGLRGDGRRLRGRRRTCCAGPSRRSRSPRSGCPACGWWRSPARGSTRPRSPAPDGRRGPRLRARPAPAPRGVRPGRRAGRADHHDGAGRRPPAVPVRAARPPLRAAGARAAAARAVRRRAPAGLRRAPIRSSSPSAIAAEIDRPVDYRPVETDGAARAAALLAELL